MKRLRKTPPRITCKGCNRRVQDTFLAKMQHMYNYHPELLIRSLPRLTELSKAAGAYLGEQLKRGFLK